MLDRTTTQFSHLKTEDVEWKSGGLRDFFLYRDLGIADATHGKVIAHLVKANMAPETGTGWHRHEADFQIVIMTKGWARFMYEDKETLVQAGDVVHQRPGIRHYLFDYSPDMEYLEIVSPADFKSIDVDPVCEIPKPTPWVWPWPPSCARPAPWRPAEHGAARHRHPDRRRRLQEARRRLVPPVTPSGHLSHGFRAEACDKWPLAPTPQGQNRSGGGRSRRCCG